MDLAVGHVYMFAQTLSDALMRSYNMSSTDQGFPDDDFNALVDDFKAKK